MHTELHLHMRAHLHTRTHICIYIHICLQLSHSAALHYITSHYIVSNTRTLLRKPTPYISLYSIVLFEGQCKRCNDVWWCWQPMILAVECRILLGNKHRPGSCRCMGCGQYQFFTVHSECESHQIPFDYGGKQSAHGFSDEHTLFQNVRKEINVMPVMAWTLNIWNAFCCNSAPGWPVIGDRLDVPDQDPLASTSYGPQQVVSR